MHESGDLASTSQPEPDPQRVDQLIKGLTALRRTQKGPLRLVHLLDRPRLLALLGPGDDWTRLNRLKDAFRGLARDPDVEAAGVMLGLHPDFSGDGDGVEDRVEKYAEVSFLDKATVRRRGNRGIPKIARYVAKPIRVGAHTPIVHFRVWLGEQATITVAISRPHTDYHPLPDPRITFGQHSSPWGYSWVSDPHPIVLDDEAFDVRRATFVVPLVELTGSATFWFPNVFNFRTVVEVVQMVWGVHVQTLRIHEGVVFEFKDANGYLGRLARAEIPEEFLKSD